MTFVVVVDDGDDDDDDGGRGGSGICFLINSKADYCVCVWNVIVIPKWLPMYASIPYYTIT